MIFGKNVNLYYKKYFLFFFIGVLALLYVNYYQLELPAICREVLDGIKDKSIYEDTSIITGLMKQILIIACVMFFGRVMWRTTIFGAAIRIESDIREVMFVHASSLSQQFYKEHKTGALMALFTNDLQTVKQGFSMGPIMFVDALFLGILALYKMFKTNYILASFSLIPMIILAILAVVIGRVLEKKFKVRQQAYEDLSDFTQENFSGIAVIKAFVKEIHEIRHFDKLNDENYAKNIDFIKYATILNILLNLLLTTIIVILIGGGCYFVVNGFGGKEFTTGQLWEFYLYFQTVIWPFMAVAQLINIRAQGKASLTRIDEFLDTKIDVVDEDVINVNELSGKIEFKNLDFKYPDGSNDVLKDISFTINSGEMVGIIGATGSGKTTIVDLLLRIYNINKNQLFFDDIDIMSLSYKTVRDSIGYVPQDNFLFSDTITNNIGFSFSLADDNAIHEAAKLADVHTNIMEFSSKYETVLGERGVTLSGGQKQRVSIARALIKNPPILIFDDSVSAVDTKTEEKILSNLRSLRKNKTTIMIAHRISTVETLDKIIVMDNGKIEGVGTHTQLIETSHIYKEMVRLQSLENEIDNKEDN